MKQCFYCGSNEVVVTAWIDGTFKALGYEVPLSHVEMMCAACVDKAKDDGQVVTVTVHHDLPK